MANNGLRPEELPPSARIALLVVDLLNDLLRVSGHVDSLAEVDAVLHRTVTRLGEAGGFDRLFIFQHRTDGSAYNSHEWVGPGIASVQHELQDVRTGELTHWVADLRAGRTILVEDASKLPEGSPERALLMGHLVKTCLIVPLMDGEEQIGSLGQDTVHRTRPVSPQELFLFESVARAVATVLSRARATRALQASRARLEATLRAVPDLVLEFDGNGRFVGCQSAVAGPEPLFRRPLAGQVIEQAVPPALAMILRDMIAEAALGQRMGLREVRLDTLWLEVSGAGVAGPAGGSVFVLRDVTAERLQAASLLDRQREAQEARAQLMTAVEALPNGFALYDAEDRLVLYNQRYCEMYAQVADVIRAGARYDDMTRASLARGLYPEAVGREEEFLAELLASRTGEDTEVELHLNDGRILIVNERRTPDGGRVGLRTDVTVQRRFEQRLANVIDGAQVGIWEWDAITGHTRINDRWLTMLGYPAETLASSMTILDWEAYLHPDDRQLVQDTISQLYRQQITRFEYGIRLRHADGHWVWIQSRGRVLRRQADGTPRLLAGVHIDISDAKAMEFALSQERDMLARLMETSVSGIVALDTTGRIVFANREAESVLGIGQGTRGWLFGIDDSGIPALRGSAIPTMGLPVMRVLSTRETLREYRHVILRPDGKRRVLSINATPLTSPLPPGETVAAVVCAVTDVTDMVEAEVTMQAAMARAEAASRAKSDFLANMSHEIRTPLNGVLGMAEILSSRLQDPALRDIVGVIRQSGLHLLDLINDILDLSKVESGHMVLDHEPLSLPDLAARIEALHAIAAQAKGVALVVDVAQSAHGWRMGDARRVTQILHNLVGNAVKFTDVGEVRLRFREEAGSIQIEVSDTGIGMDPTRIDHIFEDFTQGDSGITRKFGGTGLGMPITQRLVRLMGGTLRVEAALGKGVRICASIPMPAVATGADMTQQPANAAASAPHLAPRPPVLTPISAPLAGAAGRRPDLPQLPRLRVLVAEDNATNRLVLRTMLDVLGLDHHIVADGEEAVEAWAPQAFDLLLFDISMPKRDGISALREVHRRAAAMNVASPPALAVTANAMTHHVAEYIEAGFVACVPKPLRLDSLAGAIAKSVLSA